jgi:uncharacterized protein
MSQIKIVKLNYKQQETWSYTGRVIERGPDFIHLEAFFDRPDTDVHGMLLKTGDRFLETFYSNRWYNIFEIHDRDDKKIKGWYCNIGYPADIKEDRLSYVDLELDLLIFPDGRQLVLDVDEFNALPLSDEEHRQAKEALVELQSLSWPLHSHPGSGHLSKDESQNQSGEHQDQDDQDDR